MSQHTPGPWTVKLVAGTRWIESESREYPNEPIARVEPFNVQDEQNARLIAAAPRMLALLAHVPHNNMTATHKMIGQVAGCPGCDAEAILRDVEGGSNG